MDSFFFRQARQKQPLLWKLIKGGIVMLVKAICIAVEEDRAEEVCDVLTNDFGVAIVDENVYEEQLCWAEPEPRVYFECFVPFNRVEALTDYLDNVFTGMAILASL